jgi:hypothetical protein
MTCLVHPVFEDFTTARRCGNQRPVVWSESREDGKFLASHQHVDRINLDDSHVVERSAQMTAVNSPKGTIAMEALCSKRRSAGLRNR